MKKITNTGVWTLLKNIFKYSAYLVIIIDGITNIMSQIEKKDSNETTD